MTTAQITAGDYGEKTIVYYWDPIGLAYVVGTQPGGGSGGGGAATIADGADVAQGTTSDVAWVSGSGTVISLLKKIASAGGSAVSVADGADVTQGAKADTAWDGAAASPTAQAILKYLGAKLEAVRALLAGTITVSGSVTTGGLTDTQLRATPVPVSGTVTANAGTNLNTSALALDATLTGGTQKSKLVDTGGTNVASVSAAGALKVDASGVAVPITDNAGSLTVDAPVATPVFVRLSDGAAAIGTLPVSLASAPSTAVTNAGTFAVQATLAAETTKVIGTVNVAASQSIAVTQATAASLNATVSLAAAQTLATVTTVAAVTAITNALPTGTNTLGSVKLTDGTNVATVKAASTAAVAADTAQVVALSPNSPAQIQSSTQFVTATGIANAAVTLTLAAAGAGLFHYITSLHISRNATAALAGTATLVITSTNITGSPAWSVGNAMVAGGTQNDVVLVFSSPIKVTTANTNTTIIAPVPGAAVLWRINATYYTGA